LTTAQGDTQRDPKEFTIAPSDAIRLVLKKAHLSVKDVSLFEINEAFSVVVLANQQV
jgi:acetyl-CoA C-acetyltransferase